METKNQKNKAIRSFEKMLYSAGLSSKETSKPGSMLNLLTKEERESLKNLTSDQVSKHLSWIWISR